MANNFVEPAQHDTQTCSVHPEEQPGTSAAGLISVSDDPPTSQPSKMNVKRSADQMENIREYHTQMIEELGGLFSRKQWRSICNKIKIKNYVSTRDMDDVESMEDLCITLRKKGVIKHGEYKKLRAILVTFDVEAGKIIDDVTSKIRQEMEGPSPARQPRMEEQSTEIDSRLRPMIETTTAMILEEKEKCNFFQTKSFQVAKKKLLKNRLVVIRGNSGDGKTSMALELLRLLCCDGVDGQRRQPLELHDIPDFKSVAPKSQLVIYVDDIFGKNVVRKHDVDEWENREESILSKFCGKEHRAGNFLVITVRNGIFNSLKGSLPKVFTKENIVDVNLDKQEKLELLRLYKPKDNFDSWKSREEKAIIRYAPHLGFPQCCRLFRDTPTLHTERVQFFKSPTDFLKSSLSKLEDGKFSGLMYLFLKGGLVWENDVDPHNENIDQAVLEAAFAVDVVKVAPVGDPLYRMPKERKIEFVKNTLDCLLGWLVKKELKYGQTVCYQFNHDSIEETVALLYREKTPIGFIQNCPLSYLRYITTSQTTPNQIVISSDNQKNAMYKRLVREFESENKGNWFDKSGWIHLTMILDVWEDDKFFIGFIRWLTGQDVDKNLCHDIKLALLNVACSSSSEDRALFLLSEGVIPDLETLFSVLQGRCVNVLGKLLEYDIYTTARAHELQLLRLTCIKYILRGAILSKRQEMVFMIFDRYPHLVHDTDKLGQSLLHRVTRSGGCDLFQRVERVVLNSLCGVEDEEHKCEVVNGRVVHIHCACAQYICQLVDHRGHTVLHTSRYRGNRDVCKYLCESYPALATVVDNKGKTVLHSSYHWRWRYTHEYQWESFKAMTAFVCNDRETEFYTDFNDCESFKVLRTVINIDTRQSFTAISGNRSSTTDVCKYICDLFPALTTVVNYNGENVLHCSCKAGYSDIVKYLCESFPALTAVVSNDGRHCLHYIAESRFSNVDMFIECETHVKQYLESTGREYDITTIRDNEGNSVLHLAKKGATGRREREFKRKFGDDWGMVVDKMDPLYDHIIALFGQEQR